MASVICYDYEGNPFEVDSSQIKKRVSAYGIYIKDNKVVLTNDAGTDRWDLPGGGAEEGETVEAALKREFVEETGMEIDGEVKLFKSTQEYYWAQRGEAWDSNRNYFIVKKVKGELQKDINRHGTASAKFVKLSDLEKCNIKPIIRDLINEAVNMNFV